MSNEKQNIDKHLLKVIYDLSIDPHTRDMYSKEPAVRFETLQPRSEINELHLPKALNDLHLRKLVNLEKTSTLSGFITDDTLITITKEGIAIARGEDMTPYEKEAISIANRSFRISRWSAIITIIISIAALIVSIIALKK